MYNEIQTKFRYTGEFGQLRQQISALSKDVGILNSRFRQMDVAASKAMLGAARSFQSDLSKIGAFKTSMVDMTTAVDRFGQSLMKQKLTLREYAREASQAFKSTSNTRRLAEREVARMQSQLVDLGSVGGRRKGMLISPLAADMSSFAARTAIARKQFDIFSKLVNDGATKLLDFGKNTQWAGRQLMVGLTLPITMFGAAVTKVFFDVEKELTRFAKVYGSDFLNANTDATSKMKAQVLDLAKTISSEYGIAAKDTAALAADLAATGLEGEKLLSTVKETSRLAVLGEVDRQQAMKATIALQTTFNLSSKQLAEAVDFLNSVENQTSTSLEDLTNAIPRAGAVIHSLGGDVKDLSVLLVAMKEGGIDAGQGANALKSGLASLINPTKQASEMAKQYGIDLQNIAQANSGKLMPTLIAFQDSLKTLSSYSRARLIEQIFGKYQFARISALFENLGKQGSQTQKVIDLMRMSTIDLAKQSYREMTTLAESAPMKFKRATETFKNAMMPLGTTLAKTVTPIVEKTGKMFESILSVLEKLPSPIKSFLKFGAGITVMLGPVIMMVGLFANFGANIIKLVNGLTRFTRAMAGIKSKPLEILSDEALAAKLSTDKLTTSFIDQKRALESLEASLRGYLATLAGIQKAAPGLTTTIPRPFTPIDRLRVRGGASSPVKKADGGYVSGPGTGTSDSIPAMLSNGEYVIKASSVKKYGKENLDAINNAPGYVTGGKVFAHIVPPKSPGKGISLTYSLGLYADSKINSRLRKIPPEVDTQLLINDFRLPGSESQMAKDFLAFIRMYPSSKIKPNASKVKSSIMKKLSGYRNEEINDPELYKLSLSDPTIKSYYDLFVKKQFLRDTRLNVSKEALLESGWRQNPDGTLTYRGPKKELTGMTIRQQMKDSGKYNWVDVETEKVVARSSSTNKQRNIDFSKQTYKVHRSLLRGRGIGKATGGYVSGPEADTPAYLSNGEYVMSRDAVAAHGEGFMRSLNSGVAKFAMGGRIAGIRRYNSAGNVQRTHAFMEPTMGAQDFLAFSGGMQNLNPRIQAIVQLAIKLEKQFGVGIIRFNALNNHVYDLDAQINQDMRVGQAGVALDRFREELKRTGLNKFHTMLELTGQQLKGLGPEARMALEKFDAAIFAAAGEFKIIDDSNFGTIITKAFASLDVAAKGIVKPLYDLKNSFATVRVTTDATAEQLALFGAEIAKDGNRKKLRVVQGTNQGAITLGGDVATRGGGYTRIARQNADAEIQKQTEQRRITTATEGKLARAETELLAVTETLAETRKIEVVTSRERNLRNIETAPSMFNGPTSIITSPPRPGEGKRYTETESDIRQRGAGSAMIAFSSLATLPFVLDGIKNSTSGATKALYGFMLAMEAVQMASMLRGTGGLRVVNKTTGGLTGLGGTAQRFAMGRAAAASTAGNIAGATRWVSLASKAKYLTNPWLLLAAVITGSVIFGIHKYREAMRKVKEEASAPFKNATESAKLYNVELNTVKKSVDKVISAMQVYNENRGKKPVRDEQVTKVVQKDYKSLISSIAGESGQYVNAQLQSAMVSMMAQGFAPEMIKELLKEIAYQSGNSAIFDAFIKQHEAEMSGGEVGKVFVDAFNNQLEANRTKDWGWFFPDQKRAEAQAAVVAGAFGNAIKLMSTDASGALEQLNAVFNNKDVPVGTEKFATILGDIAKQLGTVEGSPLFELLTDTNAGKETLEVAIQAKTLGIPEDTIVKLIEGGNIPDLELQIIAKTAGLEAAQTQLTQLKELQETIDTQAQNAINTINSQINAVQNLEDAEDKQHKNKMDAFDNEEKAINKKMDLINKNADLYIKSLQREKDAENYYANQRKTAIGGLQALASGDIFGFMAARNQMSADAFQYGKERQIDQINENRDAQNAALQTKLDQIETEKEAEDNRHEQRMENLTNERKALEADKAAVEAYKTSVDNSIAAAEQNTNPERIAAAYSTLTTFFDIKNPKSPAKAIQDALSFKEGGVQLTNLQNSLTNLTQVYGQIPNSWNQGINNAITNLLKTPEYTGFTFSELKGLIINSSINGVYDAKGNKITVSPYVTSRSGTTGYAPDTSNLPGSRGWAGKAQGGAIFGAGGPTDDKIPAWLSNGEYVIKASSVKKYGVDTMDEINAGRYADGGLIQKFGGGGLSRILPKIFKVGNSFFGRTSGHYENMEASLHLNPISEDVGRGRPIETWLIDSIYSTPGSGKLAMQLLSHASRIHGEKLAFSRPDFDFNNPHAARLALSAMRRGLIDIHEPGTMRDQVKFIDKLRETAGLPIFKQRGMWDRASYLARGDFRDLELGQELGILGHHPFASEVPQEEILKSVMYLEQLLRAEKRNPTDLLQKGGQLFYRGIPIQLGPNGKSLFYRGIPISKHAKGGLIPKFGGGGSTLGRLLSSAEHALLKRIWLPIKESGVEASIRPRLEGFQEGVSGGFIGVSPRGQQRYIKPTGPGAISEYAISRLYQELGAPAQRFYLTRYERYGRPQNQDELIDSFALASDIRPGLRDLDTQLQEARNAGMSHEQFNTILRDKMNAHLAHDIVSGLSDIKKANLISTSFLNGGPSEVSRLDLGIGLLQNLLGSNFRTHGTLWIDGTVPYRDMDSLRLELESLQQYTMPEHSSSRTIKKLLMKQMPELRKKIVSRGGARNVFSKIMDEINLVLGTQGVDQQYLRILSQRGDLAADRLTARFNNIAELIGTPKLKNGGLIPKFGGGGQMLSRLFRGLLNKTPGMKFMPPHKLPFGSRIRGKALNRMFDKYPGTYQEYHELLRTQNLPGVGFLPDKPLDNAFLEQVWKKRRDIAAVRDWRIKRFMEQNAFNPENISQESILGIPRDITPEDIIKSKRSTPSTESVDIFNKIQETELYSKIRGNEEMVTPEMIKRMRSMIDHFTNNPNEYLYDMISLQEKGVSHEQAVRVLNEYFERLKDRADFEWKPEDIKYLRERFQKKNIDETISKMEKQFETQGLIAGSPEAQEREAKILQRIYQMAQIRRGELGGTSPHLVDLDKQLGDAWEKFTNLYTYFHPGTEKFPEIQTGPLSAFKEFKGWNERPFAFYNRPTGESQSRILRELQEGSGFRFGNFAKGGLIPKFGLGGQLTKAIIKSLFNYSKNFVHGAFGSSRNIRFGTKRPEEFDPMNVITYAGEGFGGAWTPAARRFDKIMMSLAKRRGFTKTIPNRNLEKEFGTIGPNPFAENHFVRVGDTDAYLENSRVARILDNLLYNRSSQKIYDAGRKINIRYNTTKAMRNIINGARRSIIGQPSMLKKFGFTSIKAIEGQIPHVVRYKDFELEFGGKKTAEQILGQVIARPIGASSTDPLAGSMSWGGRSEPFTADTYIDPFVSMIGVAPKYRRQGLATAMWNFAKMWQPNLRHSTDRSEDGYAWSEAISVLEDLPVGRRIITSRNNPVLKGFSQKLYPSADDPNTIMHNAKGGLIPKFAGGGQVMLKGFNFNLSKFKEMKYWLSGISRNSSPLESLMHPKDVMMRVDRSQGPGMYFGPPSALNSPEYARYGQYAYKPVLSLIEKIKLLRSKGFINDNNVLEIEKKLSDMGIHLDERIAPYLKISQQSSERGSGFDLAQSLHNMGVTPLVEKLIKMGYIGKTSYLNFPGKGEAAIWRIGEKGWSVKDLLTGKIIKFDPNAKPPSLFDPKNHHFAANGGLIPKFAGGGQAFSRFFKNIFYMAGPRSSKAFNKILLAKQKIGEAGKKYNPKNFDLLGGMTKPITLRDFGISRKVPGNEDVPIKVLNRELSPIKAILEYAKMKKTGKIENKYIAALLKGISEYPQQLTGPIDATLSHYGSKWYGGQPSVAWAKYMDLYMDVPRLGAAGEHAFVNTAIHELAHTQNMRLSQGLPGALSHEFNNGAEEANSMFMEVLSGQPVNSTYRDSMNIDKFIAMRKELLIKAGHIDENGKIIKTEQSKTLLRDLFTRDDQFQRSWHEGYKQQIIRLMETQAERISPQHRQALESQIKDLDESLEIINNSAYTNNGRFNSIKYITERMGIDQNELFDFIGHPRIGIINGKPSKASLWSKYVAARAKHMWKNADWKKAQKFASPPKQFASGGHVTGPGGPTDDKIPAMLSAGEYVIKASSVDKYGKDFFDGINTQRFATGGIVQKFENGGFAGGIFRNPSKPKPNKPKIVWSDDKEDNSIYSTWFKKLNGKTVIVDGYPWLINEKNFRRLNQAYSGTRGFEQWWNYGHPIKDTSDRWVNSSMSKSGWGLRMTGIPNWVGFATDEKGNPLISKNQYGQPSKEDIASENRSVGIELAASLLPFGKFKTFFKGLKYGKSIIPKIPKFRPLFKNIGNALKAGAGAFKLGLEPKNLLNPFYGNLLTRGIKALTLNSGIKWLKTEFKNKYAATEKSSKLDKVLSNAAMYGLDALEILSLMGLGGKTRLSAGTIRKGISPGVITKFWPKIVAWAERHPKLMFGAGLVPLGAFGGMRFSDIIKEYGDSYGIRSGYEKEMPGFQNRSLPEEPLIGGSEFATDALLTDKIFGYANEIIDQRKKFILINEFKNRKFKTDEEKINAATDKAKAEFYSNTMPGNGFLDLKKSGLDEEKIKFLQENQINGRIKFWNKPPISEKDLATLGKKMIGGGIRTADTLLANKKGALLLTEKGNFIPNTSSKDSRGGASSFLYGQTGPMTDRLIEAQKRVKKEFKQKSIFGHAEDTLGMLNPTSEKFDPLLASLLFFPLLGSGIRGWKGLRGRGTLKPDSVSPEVPPLTPHADRPGYASGGFVPRMHMGGLVHNLWHLAHPFSNHPDPNQPNKVWGRNSYLSYYPTMPNGEIDSQHYHAIQPVDDNYSKWEQGLINARSIAAQYMQLNKYGQPRMQKLYPRPADPNTNKSEDIIKAWKRYSLVPYGENDVQGMLSGYREIKEKNGRTKLVGGGWGCSQATAFLYGLYGYNIKGTANQQALGETQSVGKLITNANDLKIGDLVLIAMPAYNRDEKGKPFRDTYEFPEEMHGHAKTWLPFERSYPGKKRTTAQPHGNTKDSRGNPVSTWDDPNAKAGRAWKRFQNESRRLRWNKTKKKMESDYEFHHSAIISNLTKNRKGPEFPGNIIEAGDAAIYGNRPPVPNTVDYWTNQFGSRWNNSPSVFSDGKIANFIIVRRLFGSNAKRKKIDPRSYPKGTPTFKYGGHISGPGTGTSDSIPAMLSNGEYVIKASSVNKYGLPAMEAINSGIMPEGNIKAFARGGKVGMGIAPSSNRFANGGLVSPRAASVPRTRPVSIPRPQSASMPQLNSFSRPTYNMPSAPSFHAVTNNYNNVNNNHTYTITINAEGANAQEVYNEFARQMARYNKSNSMGGRISG